MEQLAGMPAIVEPLEPRTLFAVASCTVTDLNAQFPSVAANGIQPIELTNGGLVAFNHFAKAGGTTLDKGYVYSTTARRLFAQPSGMLIADVNDAGESVVFTNSGNVSVVVGGTLQTVFSKATSPQTTFTPSGINLDGDVVGTLVGRVINSPLGNQPLSQTAAFTAAARRSPQVTGPQWPAFPPDLVPRINDQGFGTTFSVANASAGAAPLDVAVLFNLGGAPTVDIGSLFAGGTRVVATALSHKFILVGTYQRGRSRVGFFRYNIVSHVVEQIAQTAAAAAPTPTAVNESGDAVGTATITVRSRGHVHHVTHAFLFAADGSTQDLNALAARSLPKGATLTGAAAINDSGVILATGTGIDGVQHAYLLTPNASAGLAIAFRGRGR